MWVCSWGFVNIVQRKKREGEGDRMAPGGLGINPRLESTFQRPGEGGIHRERILNDAGRITMQGVPGFKFQPVKPFLRFDHFCKMGLVVELTFVELLLHVM
jgi:hypothetical protein